MPPQNRPIGPRYGVLSHTQARYPPPSVSGALYLLSYASMAQAAGFEPATGSFGDYCSRPLSYACILSAGTFLSQHLFYSEQKGRPSHPACARLELRVCLFCPHFFFMASIRLLRWAACSASKSMRICIYVDPRATWVARCAWEDSNLQLPA